MSGYVNGKNVINQVAWEFNSRNYGMKCPLYGLELSAMEKIDPELEIVLATITPILGSAMGNLGNNVHFYILNDKSQSSLRLLDPYQKGLLDIQLVKRNDGLMTANIEMPLNSLFVPRKCSNGKNAHITWKYCPWTGMQLEN